MEDIDTDLEKYAERFGYLDRAGIQGLNLATTVSETGKVVGLRVSDEAISLWTPRV